MSELDAFVVADLVGEVGGASKATRLLCEALRRMGVKTKLFVTGRPDRLTAERLSRAGVRVQVPLLDKGWRYGLPSELLALQTAAAIVLEPPALVIVVGVSETARRLLRLRPKAPLWLWETTEALPHVKFIDLQIRNHLRRAAGILVPSDTVAANASGTYGYAGPILKLPFWVESPPSVPAQSDRTQQLLYVGRLDMDKGFRPLFEGFRQLERSHPRARLVVCGGGDIEGVRSASGGNERIEILGRVDDEELERRFATSEALILPSLHEGYPLTLLEACARGCPVIASAVGSIPEVYGQRPCALIVPPGDATALARAMGSLLDDDVGTRETRRADALQLFRERSSTEAIERYLRQLF